MKRIAGLLCLLIAVAAAGQQSDRILFPKTSFGGYMDFELAPPHNEWDLNRCDAHAGDAQYGGVNAPCAAFARWSTGGYFEFKPINWGRLKHLYFWGSPKFFFGNNLPQTLYSWSFSAIGFERVGGFYYELPWGLEARLTGHSKMHWFGKYQRTLGAADLHGDGPFAQYNTIGIRWKFGTFGKGRRAE